MINTKRSRRDYSFNQTGRVTVNKFKKKLSLEIECIQRWQGLDELIEKCCRSSAMNGHLVFCFLSKNIVRLREISG